MIGNKEERIKGENFKLFLKHKNITEEYFKLVEGSNLIDQLITNEYEKFIEKMAEKYQKTLEICGLSAQEINPKNPVNKRFTNFIRLEVETTLDKSNLPTEIVSKGDIKLIKWKNHEKNENFYSIDIIDKDIGVTTYASFNIEEVKNIFEKNCYFRNLEKEDEKNLQKMLEYSFGYDTDLSKVLVFEEKVIGRKSELIKFFKEELEKVDIYFKEPEKQAEERKAFIESTKETIEELEENDGKHSLEPVVLYLHSMDNTFHILNKEDQLQQLKYYSEYLEEINEKSKEDEEDLEQ